MNSETRMKNELKMIIMGDMDKDDYFLKNGKPVVNINFAHKGVRERPLVSVFNGRQMTLDNFTEDDINGGFQALDVVINPAVFDIHGHSEGMDFCSKNALHKYKNMQK